MNYGLIPDSVCETLYRESKYLFYGKTAVGSSFLPFFHFCIIFIGYSVFNGY